MNRRILHGFVVIILLGCSRPEATTTNHEHTPPAAHETAGGDILMCNEHGVPESECGICHPELAGKLAAGDGMKVRFPSAGSAASAGVSTAHPERGAMSDGIDCTGELAFNQNRTAEIVAPVGGILAGVEGDLGQVVRAGQLLAGMRSSALGEAVSEASLAKRTLERERQLRASGISTQRALEEAEAAWGRAEQELRSLGYSTGEIEALKLDDAGTGLLPVRAPFSGEIVERRAVIGSFVEAGAPLFTLSDRSTIWVLLHVPERAAGGIRVGQRVEFRADALPGEVVTGTLTWISARIDERSRMMPARAELRNVGGALRAGMFGRARIVTGGSHSSVVVPSSALQQVGDRPFVFVRLADDLYEARAVLIGLESGDRAEVVDGLGLGDDVVVSGSFIAKSQLLLSRLGAGCAD